MTPGPARGARRCRAPARHKEADAPDGRGGLARTGVQPRPLSCPTAEHAAPGPRTRPVRLLRGQAGGAHLPGHQAAAVPCIPEGGPGHLGAEAARAGPVPPGSVSRRPGLTDGGRRPAGPAAGGWQRTRLRVRSLRVPDTPVLAAGPGTTPRLQAPGPRHPLLCQGARLQAAGSEPRPRKATRMALPARNKPQAPAPAFPARPRVSRAMHLVLPSTRLEILRDKPQWRESHGPSRGSRREHLSRPSSVRLPRPPFGKHAGCMA